MQKFYKIHRANGVFITQYVIVECVCLYVCVCVCIFVHEQGDWIYCTYLIVPVLLLPQCSR